MKVELHLFMINITHVPVDLISMPCVHASSHDRVARVKMKIEKITGKGNMHIFSCLNHVPFNYHYSSYNRSFFNYYIFIKFIFLIDTMILY